MADYDVDPWTCENGHVLGHVFRTGSKVRRLALYRQAVDLKAAELEPVDVMAVVDGHVVDIRCSKCGCVRTWYPGEESLKRLLRQHKRMMEQNIS